MNSICFLFPLAEEFVLWTISACDLYSVSKTKSIMWRIKKLKWAILYSMVCWKITSQ